MRCLERLPCRGQIHHGNLPGRNTHLAHSGNVALDARNRRLQGAENTEFVGTGLISPLAAARIASAESLDRLIIFFCIRGGRKHHDFFGARQWLINSLCFAHGKVIPHLQGFLTLIRHVQITAGIHPQIGRFKQIRFRNFLRRRQRDIDGHEIIGAVDAQDRRGRFFRAQYKDVAAGIGVQSANRETDIRPNLIFIFFKPRFRMVGYAVHLRTFTAGVVNKPALP